MRFRAEYEHDPDVVVLRRLTLPRVLDVIRRDHPTGCPSCGVELAADVEPYCEPCGVFKCPRCKLWRHVDDGGGDDPKCNDCWWQLRTVRRVYARRLARELRPRRLARQARRPRARRELDVERDRRAGCLILRRSRSSGTVVGLYRADEAGLDADAGPFATVCEDHGGIVNHRTRSIAESHLSHPIEWCPRCQGDEDA